MVTQALTDIIASHTSGNPRASVDILERAYETASRLHAGRRRGSGVDHVNHSLAVASIVADLGMDTTTLVATLLHEATEDTDYTPADLRADFGDDVASVVDGLARLDKVKLDKVKLGDPAEADTIRKLMVSAAEDPRVLVVKVADRLCSMRALSLLPPPEREQKARETLEIMAPLAHRLRLSTVRCELEDLSFATLFPERFQKIGQLVEERYPQRDNVLREVVDRLSHDLRSTEIDAKVSGRLKHLYSIHQKMAGQGLGFEQINDLVGIRILVDTVRDCYAALGVINAVWEPVPGRFEDYIATPGINLYQSLHTTVIGPTGKPVEMQIRTHAMHGTAEYGIAAHWTYEHGEASAAAGPASHVDGMTWLRQLLAWQGEPDDPGEFLDAMRQDLSSQEMFVFTPMGEVVALPNGSTPVDFAYAVHTEVGHRCIGARVNSKLVPLESALSNNDVVEIVTSESQTAGPTRDWLGFVKSSRARTKIRQYFSKQRQQGLPPQRLPTSGGQLAIQVEASDRPHLLGDITRALSEQRADILTATVTTRDRMVVSHFSFEMVDPKRLSRLLNAVRDVEGVVDAYSVAADEEAPRQPDSPS